MTPAAPRRELDPTSPFPEAVVPRIRDRPGRLLELSVARARGREAPPPSWLRRRIVSWQVDGPGPGPAVPSARARPEIHAVVGVWNEEDIVYALVKHLHAQGVDHVLVIDDESDDATAGEAALAGAEILPMRSTGGYSEAVRTQRFRDAIATGTDAGGGDVWWLVLDADEFPRGPGGTTVRKSSRAPRRGSMSSAPACSTTSRGSRSSTSRGGRRLSTSRMHAGFAAPSALEAIGSTRSCGCAGRATWSRSPATTRSARATAGERASTRRRS